MAHIFEELKTEICEFICVENIENEKEYYIGYGKYCKLSVKIA